MMCRCWAATPSDRPTFGDLVGLVPGVVSALERSQGQSAQLNAHYEPVSFARASTSSTARVLPSTSSTSNDSVIV